VALLFFLFPPTRSRKKEVKREIATISFGNPLAAACDVGMFRPASELTKENARRKKKEKNHKNVSKGSAESP